jgi:hypothetical protein
MKKVVQMKAEEQTYPAAASTVALENAGVDLDIWIS